MTKEKTINKLLPLIKELNAISAAAMELDALANDQDLPRDSIVWKLTGQLCAAINNAQNILMPIINEVHPINGVLATIIETPFGPTLKTEEKEFKKDTERLVYNPNANTMTKMISFDNLRESMKAYDFEDDNAYFSTRAGEFKPLSTVEKQDYECFGCREKTSGLFVKGILLRTGRKHSLFQGDNCKCKRMTFLGGW